MSEWSIFGVNVTPKFTEDTKNILKVTSKKEIFFDVFECVFNNENIIVEKIGENEGLPVVRFETLNGNTKLACEAILVKDDECELYINENNLQFIKNIQKPVVRELVHEKVEKIIPVSTVHEDNIRSLSQKIVSESEEKAQKLYEDKLQEYKVRKQEITDQAEQYLNKKSESIKQELNEHYIDFLSSNDENVKHLIERNIITITSTVDKSIDSVLSKVSELSDSNKQELIKILSENINDINSNVDSKIEDLNDELKVILHDGDTKISKLEEKTARLFKTNVKRIENTEKNIKSKVREISEKVDVYKVETLKAIVEKVADNKSEIEDSLKRTVSEISEQVDVNSSDVKKILTAELSNINEKLNIFSEDEDKKYKQLFENLNNLNKGEVKELLSEKISDKQINSIKLDISKQFQNEMMSIKRLVEMSSGGGSVAVQYANGGVMNGDLNVTQNILSGGVNLLDIFNTDTSIDLQDVTDNGNTTTNSISTNNTIYAETGEFTTLNALTANFTQTIVSTTSALSVINDGTGPALYVSQTGVEPVAEFVDREGGTVIIDDGGNVGIGTRDPAAKLHSSGNNDTDYLALFTSNGATPDLSQPGNNKKRAIAVQGEGAAYYLGKDLTNNIEFIMGTSTAGVAFLGSLTNHGVDIRVNNQNALKINTAKDVTVVNGHLNVDSDSKYLKLGASQDAGIIYDGANMVFDSQLVGTGDFVFENGNVGIGTTTPAGKLHIAGSAPGSYIEPIVENTAAIGAAGFAFINSNQEWKMGVNTADTFRIRDHNAGVNVFQIESGGPGDSFVIDSNGNVGIGTATPLAKLDVNGRVRNTPTADGAPAGDKGLETFYSSVNDNSIIISVDRDPADAALKPLRMLGSNLEFWTGSALSNDAQRLTILPTGNVGIGTSSPDELLHLEATLDLNDGVFNKISDINGQDAYLGVYRYGSGNRYGMISFDEPDGSNYSFLGSPTFGTALNSASGKDIYLRIGNVDKMVIASDGNVGIGTSSPSTTLDVDEAVFADVNGIRIGGDTTFSPSVGVYNTSALHFQLPNNFGTGNTQRETFFTAKVDGSDSYFAIGNGTSVTGVMIPYFRGYNADDVRGALSFTGVKKDNSDGSTYSASGRYSPALQFAGSQAGGALNSNVPTAGFNGATSGTLSQWFYNDGRAVFFANQGQNNAGAFVADPGNYQMTVMPRDASTVGYYTKLFTSATADAILVENSAGVDLFKVDASGGGYFAGNVGIGTDSPSAKLEVVGHFTATTKSFKIDNPQTGGKLQYGVVESDEHGVYVRGKTNQKTITLPDHWDWLVDEDSVTVTVTPIGKFQGLYVVSQNNETVEVGGVEGEYNYVIYGTRKDVAPLEVNI